MELSELLKELRSEDHVSTLIVIGFAFYLT